MTDKKLQDIDRLRLLRLLHDQPAITQREIARKVGLSLGKVNYCLRALVSIGYVKAGNFSRSDNKLGYTYLLTPEGVAEKASVTLRFLARKLVEYNKLKVEIEELKAEALEIEKI